MQQNQNEIYMKSGSMPLSHKSHKEKLQQQGSGRGGSRICKKGGGQVADITPK